MSAPQPMPTPTLDEAEATLRSWRLGSGSRMAVVLTEYDRRAAEIERLGDALAEADQEQIRTDDRIGETRDGVMAAIEAAGLAPHVCDDDDLPDMVRHALTAAKQLAQPSLAPEPGYERIADAIDDALKSADLRVELKTGTGPDWGRFTDSYTRELYVLARTLDKAGLIDWAAFGPAGAA